MGPGRIRQRYGYVEKSGKFAINPQFHRCEEFYGGMGKIIMDADQTVKFGYVDNSGKIVWNPTN